MKENRQFRAKIEARKCARARARLVREFCISLKCETSSGKQTRFYGAPSLGQNSTFSRALARAYSYLSLLMLDIAARRLFGALVLVT